MPVQIQGLRLDASWAAFNRTSVRFASGKPNRRTTIRATPPQRRGHASPMNDAIGERQPELRRAMRAFLKHYGLNATNLSLAAGLSENTLRLFLKQLHRTMNVDSLQKLAVAASAKTGLSVERAEEEMQGKRPLPAGRPGAPHGGDSRADEDDVYNAQLMVQLMRQMVGKLEIIAASAQRCEDALVNGLPVRREEDAEPKRRVNERQPGRRNT